MPWFWRPQARYRPQLTVDRAQGREPDTPDAALPPLLPPSDWPRIQSRHPHWWQVFRVEQTGLERRLVLIAECRTEAAAFVVAAKQASRVRITKFGSKVPAYESVRAPRMVSEGTVTRAE